MSPTEWAGDRPSEQEQLKLKALQQAIGEGDTALARAAFETYAQPGQLADALKSKLTQGRSPS